MKRRVADLERDYGALVAMQEKSWEINFPGELFFESAFRDALQRAVPRGEVFVYLADDELVGWLWMDWRMGSRRAHIRHVQVREEFWGHGYGRRIMEDAIAMSVKHRRTLVTLNVTKANERAMRLYRRIGFARERDMGDRQRMALDLSDDRKVPTRQ